MTWLVAGASLVATWLNIRKTRACFLIWLGTNITWAIYDFAHGLPAQGCLMLAYAPQPALLQSPENELRVGVAVLDQQDFYQLVNKWDSAHGVTAATGPIVVVTRATENRTIMSRPYLWRQR